MNAGFVLLALAIPVLAGCGAYPGANCTLSTVLQVGPSPATAMAAAKAPANQVQFSSSFVFTSKDANCPVPAIAQRAFPAWTNPDPIHISISSAADVSNGTAVCKGPTAGPVTLTATATYNGTQPQQLTATAQLTCN